MNVLFRCDASSTIGLGHLRRCLTLADGLRQHSARAFFACRADGLDPVPDLREAADDWDLMDMAVSAEADVAQTLHLVRDWNIDVTVVDHDRADGNYQEALRAAGVQWLQFDWSASEPLLADWVLNASPAADERLYRRLAPQATRLLLGPQYALVRPAFASGDRRDVVSGRVRRILLTIGGGDDRGLTLFCLQALQTVDPAIERLVVIGSANPAAAVIREWVERHTVATIVEGAQLASALSQADLAVIAGGTTTFEAAAMGVPSLIVQIAANQAANARAWHVTGAAIDLGPAEQLKGAVLRGAVSMLVDDPARRLEMSRAGQAAVDGRGAERVSRALLQ